MARAPAREPKDELEVEAVAVADGPRHSERTVFYRTLAQENELLVQICAEYLGSHCSL